MPAPNLTRFYQPSIRGERLEDLAREVERSFGEVSRAIQPLTDALEAGPVPGSILTLSGSWSYAPGMHTIAGLPVVILAIAFDWTADAAGLSLWCDGQVTVDVLANGVSVAPGVVVGPAGVFLGANALANREYLVGPWQIRLTAATAPPPVPTTVNFSAYLRNVAVA